MESQTIDQRDVRFFSGSSNRPLAEEITRHLNLKLEDTSIKRYSNDDLDIQLGASVRARKVFIVQSLDPPVNDHLVELLMMLDIARSASAIEIHAIIPYYSFARSDKKDRPRICITARLVADLLRTAGATHLMTMALHSPQVHGFFGMPADPLTSRPVFKSYFEKRDLESTIIVAPDMGNAKSAARFAADLKLPVAAGNKERVSDKEVRVTGMVGNQVRGYRRALVYDDEIATGGSIREISTHLVEQGIQEIWATCTHGVFVDNAVERLVEEIPQIAEIVTTDTTFIPPAKRHPKLTVLSVAHVFGDAIRHNYFRESIGDLFFYGE